MANLYRLRATWTGFSGAPGVTTMYASSPTVAVPALRAFFEAIKSQIPSVCTISVANTGDIIEDTTGELIGTWGEAAVANVVGTNASAYAAPVGACVTWASSGVFQGRRARGRTYLVPLGSSSFQTNGTIADGSVTLMSAAAHDMAVTGTDDVFRIWHRPGVGLADGGQSTITDGSVRDVAAVLRSRRD